MAVPTINPQPSTINSLTRTCAALFFSPRSSERDDNLTFVRERLLGAGSDADPAALLGLYRRVLGRRPVPDDERDPLVDLLHLSGAVRADRGRLLPSSRVVAHLYDRRWVAAHLPDAERRRQRAAFYAGVYRAAAAGTVLLALLGGLTLSAVANAREAHAAGRKVIRSEHQLVLKNRELAAERDHLRDTLRKLRLTTSERNRQAAAARSEARRADGQSREATRSAAEARENAAEARRKADEAKHAQQLAEANRHESERRTARLLALQGTRAWEDRDPYSAFLWCVRAAQRDVADPDRSRLHRVRLAALARQLPRVRHLWFDVRQVALSPDGSMVATGGQDHQLRVWELATGRPLTPVLDCVNRIHQVAFSPDSALLGVVASGIEPRIYEARTGRLRRELVGNTFTCTGIAFSPDRKRVATAAPGGSGVRVWDVETGKQLLPTLPHLPDAGAVEFSGDGKLLLSWAARSREIRVFEVDTGRLACPLLRHHGNVFGAHFSRDGTKVLANAFLNPEGFDSGGAWLWDARTGALLRRPPLPRVAALSPDDRLIAGGDADFACLLDAATGSPTGPRMPLHAPLRAVTFSRDRRRIATACADFTARVWDVANAQPLCPPLPHSGPLRSATFTPDARSLLTLDDTGSVRLWDVEPANLPDQLLGDYGNVHALDVDPSGRYAAVGSFDGVTRIVELATGRSVGAPLVDRPRIAALRWSPDGRMLAVEAGNSSASGTFHIRVYDVASRRVLLDEPGQNVALGVNWSADSTTLLVSEPDRVTIFTLATQTAKAQRYSHVNSDGFEVVPGGAYGFRTPHNAPGVGTALRPDGAAFLIAHASGTVYMRRSDTAATHTDGLLHDAELRSACLSPDGEQILTACDDAKVRLWDWRTARLLRALPLPAPPVRAGFSPDGQRVVTACAERSANGSWEVRVWDARTGLPVTEPLPHTGRAGTLAMSRDNRWLATGSADGLARVWDVASGELAVLLRVRGEVRHVAFVPGRDLRLAVLDGEGGAQLFALSPEIAPLPDLERQAELLAAGRVDDSGGLMLSDPRTARPTWERALAAPTVAPLSTPARERAWHAVQAGRCEETGDWPNALPHLRALLAAAPEDRPLRALLARALAETGQWDAALAAHASLVTAGAKILALDLEADVERASDGAPLLLGGEEIRSGLATRGRSRLLVLLPAPARRFEARVSVIPHEAPDRRPGPGGAVFTVRRADRAAAHSPPMPDGRPAVPLSADLTGATAFFLEVRESGDFADFADERALWADALIHLDDGTILRLADLPLLRPDEL